MDNQAFREIVAQNIYYLRTVNHLTQYELGEKLNYSDKAISKWERADGLPDAFVLHKMSELFGVTVDYILTEHSEQDKKIDTKPLKKSRHLIANIVMVGVSAIALLFFVIFALTVQKYYWQVFIYVLPALCIVGIVFSSVWEKGRGLFLFISGLIWSILLTIYVAIARYDIWMIFLLGIPAQIIVFLSFRIKISIKISQKEGSVLPSKKKKNKKEEEKAEDLPKE